jgi:periplasmic divalent cation tolerance protein
MIRAAAKYAVIFVTAPNIRVARRLARTALRMRLIACANLIPKVESHYRWRGKLESAAEVLMILKTTQPRLVALERLILSKHPYDTPEFLVLPLQAGTGRYLKWIDDSVSEIRP